MATFSDRFQKLPIQLTLLFIGFLSAFALQAWAYTEPASAPPAGDVPAPLNTGSSVQTKVGPLVVNTGAAAIGLTVFKGNVGIGTPSASSQLTIDQALVGGGWNAGITLKNNTGTHTGHFVESTDGGLQFGIDSLEIGRITSEGFRLSNGKIYCVTDCSIGNAGITANVVATISAGGSGSCTALALGIKGGIITSVTPGSC